MTGQMLFQRMSDTEVHGHLRGRTLAAGRTAIQSYEIVELGDFGRALLLDGCVQSTEADEALYHESLVFPAHAVAPVVRSVLCLGGANGGLLKQVLKLPDLERVLVVDIDPELHEISRRHLPHMHGDTLADPRVTLRFGDPARLVAELAADPAGGKIDIIIADLPDATAGSYAVGLFTREFYGVVCRLLGETGIYVTQGGQAHFRHCGFLNRVLRTLSASFAHAVPYTVAVPSLGTPWAFVLASQGIDPRAASPASIARRIAAIPAGEIISYDWETHLHLFHLPKLLREALAAPGQPIAAESLALVAVAAEETCGAGHS